MANMIIRPAAGTGNKVIVQDQAGAAVLTTADSGATIASGVTNSGTHAGVISSNATFPAGTITGYTSTITTPTATQGAHTNNATLTGSSVSYTPTTGASFVVYEYSAYLMANNIYTLQLIHVSKNGTLVNGLNYQINQRTDGSFQEFSPGQVHIKAIFPSWTGAQTIDVQYQQWETSGAYSGRWHSSTYSGNETGTDVYVDTFRTTYSVM